jgi:hypothetical protein
MEARIAPTKELFWDIHEIRAMINAEIKTLIMKYHIIPPKFVEFISPKYTYFLSVTQRRCGLHKFINILEIMSQYMKSTIPFRSVVFESQLGIMNSRLLKLQNLSLPSSYS